jgi:phage gp29-like protein
MADGDDDDVKAGLEASASLPEEMRRPVALPIEMQRTYFASVARMLRNPSLAYRKDKNLMKQMRNDPDCMGPLTQLQVSIAGLEWQIKPFDSRDTAQDEIAARTQEIFLRMPRFGDMIRHLLDAVWYGSSAANLVYGRRNGMVVPEDWIPFHPDTLAVNLDGAPAIRVGPRYYSDMDGTGGETQQGFDSRVHVLTPIERRAVVWHRYMVNGPDFDDPYETAYAYMGKGVRDTVWWYWNLKQAVLQNWATFAERYAQGIRLGYYPMSQKGGKEEMESILRNLVGDVSAVLPRMTPGQKDYEIEVKEPAAARAQVFADLCEWLSKNIKELIVGQAATSEAVSTGLGSSVGKEHGKTFTRQMKFVADGLAETITAQVVREIVDMNFGPQDEYPRFEFSVESPEMEKKLEAIRIFVNELGGTVSEADTRRMLGLAIPEADEPVLTGKTRDVLPEIGEDPDMEPDPEGEPMLNSKDVFSRMSDKELRREAVRRRRRGRPKGNCGNGFGGFTDSNNCASGKHNYPKNRKPPSKTRNERGVGDKVIEKHRLLVDEGYSDDQAWAIAYDMVAKTENRKRPQHSDTQAQQDRAGELVRKGMSVEQAVQVAVREGIREDDEVSRHDAALFEKDEKTGEKETFEEDGFLPPANVAANARRALEVRESKPESERGMTSVGLARARDLSNRTRLSEETVRRMARYFDRHQSDKKGETWGDKGKGWQAWNGWGGDAGWTWARRIVARLDAEKSEHGKVDGLKGPLDKEDDDE